jgi:A/G-specific adenine glycosylase
MGTNKNTKRNAMATPEPTWPFDPQDISPRLLTWYGKEGRSLPWRTTRDPYRIWLSEIMLQQTTVTAVIPYYERFLLQFPTLADLASADLEEVMSLWSGLGYYSRARNLHKAARQLMDHFQGGFPQTVEELMRLPGIGKSTAGAIRSIAFDLPAPILDGNVRRVLVRLFAYSGDPRNAQAETQLWAWADALTSRTFPHDYAQAIMDLGATICVPQHPLCSQCPLQDFCQAHARGLARLLPQRRKKQAVPIRHQVAVVIENDTHLLLRQRPAEGFLGGLWELPCCEPVDDNRPEVAARSIVESLSLAGTPQACGVIQHAYSHFKLKLAVFRLKVPKKTPLQPSQALRWMRFDEIPPCPVHGAHQKALELLERFPERVPESR